MSDDPRGHDDGDLAVGGAGERNDALDFMFRAFLTSIAGEGVYGGEDLAKACDRMARELRGRK
jgi:hypothetical protein